MKTKNIIIAAQAVALAGVVAYLLWGFRGGAVQDRIPDVQGAQAKVTAQSSSVPAKEESAQGGLSPDQTAGLVEIPLEKQRLIGVKSVPAAMQTLQKVIRTVGRIEYDERKLATVNLKLESWVEKLHADYNGKYVKKGEPLAEVYSPELHTTQEHYISIVNWTTQQLYRYFKERSVEFPFTDRYSTIGKMTAWETDILKAKARDRLKFWGMTEEQVKQIEEKKEPIRAFVVRSPISGFVVQKQVVEGSRVMPGDKLFDVADLSTVWVIADVYEYELPLIKVGEKAKVRLSYAGEKEYDARVDYIYPVVSGQTRTAKVRFVLPNPGVRIKPQMFTSVDLVIELGSRLAIPQDAIIDTGTKQVVYVDRGNGYFEPRAISTGVRTSDRAEVLKGLKAGEKVASAATFLIDSEAKLKNVVPLAEEQKAGTQEGEKVRR